MFDIVSDASDVRAPSAVETVYIEDRIMYPQKVVKVVVQADWRYCERVGCIHSFVESTVCCGCYNFHVAGGAHDKVF